jgi:hypothetical protein
MMIAHNARIRLCAYPHRAKNTGVDLGAHPRPLRF